MLLLVPKLQEFGGFQGKMVGCFLVVVNKLFEGDESKKLLDLVNGT